jgi:hypothetical protein
MVPISDQKILRRKIIKIEIGILRNQSVGSMLVRSNMSAFGAHEIFFNA